MNFKEISLDDRHTIEAFTLRYGIHNCDFSFTNLYCWRQSYRTFWCIEKGFLVIKYLFDEDHYAYSQPLGEGDFREVIDLIEKDAAPAAPTFFAITSEALESLAAHRPQWGFYHERSRSDYIYRKEDLINLNGSKYHAKRNHIHKFSSLYQWEYRPLTLSDKPHCMELLKRWQQDRLTLAGVTDFYLKEMKDEEMSIESAFDAFNALGIIGGSLWVKMEGSQLRNDEGQWRMEAFCYGSKVSSDTFCTHIEKANENLDGIYSVINREFAAHLPGDIIYINREEDLGLQGLRKSKESYHPASLLHKAISFPLDDTMMQIRELWLKCFPADNHLDAELFLATRFREENMVCHKENGVIVSMLHIIEFGDKAYIYAVATDPAFRGKGFARQIILQAIERCKSEGFSLVCLIPETEPLREWYATMGFSGSIPTIFHTGDEYDFFTILPLKYDYGTGDSDKDKAMASSLNGKPLEDLLEDGKLLLNE